MSPKCGFVVILSVLGFQGVSSVSWEEWWTYDGISGPSFWGLINPEWSLCNQGRKQSPIDINPDALLFDKNLEDVKVTDSKVSGVLSNSGHGVVFTVDMDSQVRVANITGGPLDYSYPVHSVSLHFGLRDNSGSEHTVDGKSFPGEVQIFGYNADLYENFSIAASSPGGIVCVSVLVAVGELSNMELRRITNQLSKIQYGGDSVKTSSVDLSGFIPVDPESRFDHADEKKRSPGYMTYEGSMTQPGCQETVTWIVMNRPIYMTARQFFLLRKLMQGEKSDPRAPLGGNFRPTQPQNSRTVRTNVVVRPDREGKCPTLHENLQYKANRSDGRSKRSVPNSESEIGGGS